MFLTIIFPGIVILSIIIAGILVILSRFNNKTTIRDAVHSDILIDKVERLTRDLSNLRSFVSDIPAKTLNSITSSSSTYKGKLGELIGYMELHASYDRVIPLNSIADFIGITLPTDKEEGSVDFVDIKNGPNARLSKEQRAFKQLILDKKVNFKQIHVKTTIGIISEDEENNG